MNSFDEFDEQPPKNLCLNCGKCEKPLYQRTIPCFSALPSGCGYEGFMFKQRENVKGKIRALKEAIMDLKLALKEIENVHERQKLEQEIQAKEQIILSFDEYGSKDW